MVGIVQVIQHDWLLYTEEDLALLLVWNHFVRHRESFSSPISCRDHGVQTSNRVVTPVPGCELLMVPGGGSPLFTWNSAFAHGGKHFLGGKEIRRESFRLRKSDVFHYNRLLYYSNIWFLVINSMSFFKCHINHQIPSASFPSNLWSIIYHTELLINSAEAWC